MSDFVKSLREEQKEWKDPYLVFYDDVFEVSNSWTDKRKNYQKIGMVSAPFIKRRKISFFFFFYKS